MILNRGQYVDMPTKNLNLLTQGRDDEGKFLGRKEQVDALRAAIGKLAIDQNKLNAQVVKSLGAENSLLKSKSKLHGQISKIMSKQLQQSERAAKEIQSRLKSENKLIAQNLKLSQQVQNLRKRNGGLFGSGGNRGLLRSVASIGAFAVAIRQLKEISDGRLGAYLNNGSGATRAIAALGGRNIAPVSKFQAVNEFQSSGLSQFIIGQQKEIQSGLLKAQAELSKNVGPQTANELLEGINKSFGSDSGRRREFLESVNRVGLGRSLEDFRSQYNIPEFERASNALTAPADPALQVRSQLLDVTEQLKASFEKLVLTVGKDLIPLMEKLTPTITGLLDFVGGLTTSKLAVGAGALVAARYGGSALLRGAGTGALTAAPYLARGAGQLTGRALAHSGGLGIAGLALAAGMNAKEGYGVYSDTSDAFNSVNGGRNWNPSLRGSSERDKLAFERGKIDKILSEIQPAHVEKSWLGLVQLTGELTEQQEKQVAKLGEQRRAIQRSIDALDKRSSAEQKATTSVQKTAQAQDSLSSKIQKRLELELPIAVSEGLANLSREKLGLAQVGIFGPNQASKETQALIKSLNDQKSLLEQSLATVDENLPQGVIDANNLRTQITSLEKEIKANSIGLQTLPLEFEQTLTELRRQELQFATMTPWGAVGAKPQLDEVNASLQREIEILQNIAGSTELTALEQVRVKQAIMSREIEQKQNLRALLDAYKDAALSQVAMSGGGHRSIIVSTDANLGIGLRRGMISPVMPKEIVGNIDKAVKPLMPKTALEVLGHDPFKPRYKGPGATAADSMQNLGKLAIEIANQLRSEFRDVANQLAEPIGSYASGRLSSVQ